MSICKILKSLSCRQRQQFFDTATINFRRVTAILFTITMFKKFDSSNDVSTSTPVKSSIQRAIKLQLQQQHPNISDDILEVLIPKKSSLIQYKVTSHLMLYCQRIEHEDRVPSDIPILFQHRDGPILPTLKWIHPFCCASKESDDNDETENSPSPPPSVVPFTFVQVDAGAIPYLLGGANIMCPGLTKPNGSSYMPPDDNDVPGLSKGQGVIIYAENKTYPVAVGVMTMSSLEIREKNKGIGCEITHYLGDGLYQTNEIA